MKAPCLLRSLAARGWLVLPAALLPALLLAGCAELFPPGAAITPAPTSPPTPTPTRPLSPAPEATATPGPATLRLWLPPQFMPGGETPAGSLLEARLKEFTARRSEVRLEVRAKAAEGPGGLLDSLTAANAAAPLALPDLILLPRAELETAALKGLLYPLDDLTDALDDEDWFPYAQQLARLQNTAYGLPFAGDGLVLLYRPAAVAAPPGDWQTALAVGGPLIFPAADPQALHTLAQYLATGAPIQDGEGRPTLEAGALTQVLAFYQAAGAAGVMPFWITQFTTDEQAWQAYLQNQGNLLVTWTSRYLGNLPGDTAAAPLFTPGGEPFTLANGWVWAISSPQIERHALSAELAEFLTSGDFLARWSAAAGYLPPRNSALAGWNDAALQGLAERVARSAQIVPPADVLAVLSPALQQTTIGVLKDQIDPETAARQALEQLPGP